MAEQKLQPSEIRLGGSTYKLSAKWRALTRIVESLSPQSRGAYSHMDAVRDLWRVEANGSIYINCHVLTTMLWAFMHVEERNGTLTWAGMSFDEVADRVGEFIEESGSVRQGEVALFLLVLNQLYCDRVIEQKVTDENPTEAVEAATAKAN